jgi:hypothetical protein
MPIARTNQEHQHAELLAAGRVLEKDSLSGDGGKT